MDVHEIGAVPAKDTNQVIWGCSCGSGGERTTMMLTHMIAIAEAGENLSLLFDEAVRWK